MSTSDGSNRPPPPPPPTAPPPVGRATPPPLPPAARKGRYTVVGEVGRGGMAVVHRVIDHQLRRVSAMKVLEQEHAELPVEHRRFVEEAQITGQLDHPNIVPVHELNAEGEGQPFFTMKLVEGETLSAALLRARDASRSLEGLDQFLEIFLKICDGVAFAHSRGVVHRDLKPSNILVGSFGEVYVMDWGMARVIREGDAVSKGVNVGREVGGAGLDDEGMAIGTIQFMSPEQAWGKNQLVDERTDVFALGAVLYHILTGQPPYPMVDLQEALVAAREVRIRPPEEVAPWAGLPPKLCQIAMKAMAREPEERFQSVPNLRRAVHRFLRGGMHLPTKTFARGSVVVAEGEVGNTAYIIVQGSCQAYRTVDGEKVVLRRMGAGDVFGEMAILSSAPRTASIEALEDLTVMVVTAEVLSDGLGMSSWMGAFVRALADRFREADERLITLESMMVKPG